MTQADRRLVEAYTRIRQDDLLGAQAAARAMIAAEPWDADEPAEPLP